MTNKVKISKLELDDFLSKIGHNTYWNDENELCTIVLEKFLKKYTDVRLSIKPSYQLEKVIRFGPNESIVIANSDNLKEICAYR